MRRRAQHFMMAAGHRARGFSLVTGVFILVVLAGLGAAIMRISSVQHISSAQDVQGTRAYLAARAGIEWGLFKQLRQNSCSAAPTTITLPTGTSLDGFVVTVTCSTTAVATAEGSQHIITSVACYRPSAGTCTKGAGDNGSMFVQRVVQVRF